MSTILTLGIFLSLNGVQWVENPPFRLRDSYVIHRNILQNDIVNVEMWHLEFSNSSEQCEWCVFFNEVSGDHLSGDKILNGVYHYPWVMIRSKESDNVSKFTIFQ